MHKLDGTVKQAKIYEFLLGGVVVFAVFGGMPEKVSREASLSHEIFKFLSALNFGKFKTSLESLSSKSSA